MLANEGCIAAPISRRTPPGHPWLACLRSKAAGRGGKAVAASEGLSYNLAAHRLVHLMREACRRQLSGVALKDQAQLPGLDDATGGTNFLLG